MTQHNITDLNIVLPLHVVPMLRNEGIVTLEDWQALGERRFRLYGIGMDVVMKLDRAAEEARE